MIVREFVIQIFKIISILLVFLVFYDERDRKGLCVESIDSTRIGNIIYPSIEKISILTYCL